MQALPKMVPICQINVCGEILIWVATKA